MSAGHSLRRQNYSFVTIAPPAATHSSSTATHLTRILAVVIGAAAVNLATFAILSMLVAGR